MAQTILQEPNAVWSGGRLTLLNKRTWTLLQEMEKLAGAQMACVCDLRGAALALWYANEEFTRATADRVGECVANLLTAFPGHSFREIELRYEDRLVYARTIGSAFMVVVCAPDTSLALVRMTCNVAVAPFETDAELQRYLAVPPRVDIGMRLG